MGTSAANGGMGTEVNLGRARIFESLAQLFGAFGSGEALGQPQRQLQSRTDSTGGHDVAVIDDLGFENFDAEGTEFSYRRMIGRRRPTSEKAGLGQQHRAGANRSQQDALL